MFGKKKKLRDQADDTDLGVDTEVDSGEAEHGPFDITDMDHDFEPTAEQHLDLGSVIVPVPAGGQLQVEMAPDGSPQAVHLMTEHGRLTVAAYAAPKSPGQWREVTGDLTESLRNDNASVSVETGPWGREVVAITQNADLRFIGVDGYRWMIRLVAAGPSGSVDAGGPLTEVARATLAATVVRRGTDPHPVRTPLPVTLPQSLAEQLAAAHQQQLDAQAQQGAAPEQGTVIEPQTAGDQAGQSDAPVSDPDPSGPAQRRPRRGAGGSAMQQLGQG